MRLFRWIKKKEDINETIRQNEKKKKRNKY